MPAMTKEELEHKQSSTFHFLTVQENYFRSRGFANTANQLKEIREMLDQYLAKEMKERFSEKQKVGMICD